MIIAKAFTTTVPSSDLDSLTVEVRLFQVQEDLLSANGSVEDFWQATAATNKFPSLIFFARAAMTIPHGNADVERLFSILSDVVTKKRNRFSHSYGQRIAEKVVLCVLCNKLKRCINWLHVLL